MEDDKFSIQVRLETMRWLDDEFRMVIDIIQNQKDLSKSEKNDLTKHYNELSLRLNREKRELKKLGITLK